MTNSKVREFFHLQITNSLALLGIRLGMLNSILDSLGMTLTSIENDLSNLFTDG